VAQAQHNALVGVDVTEMETLANKALNFEHSAGAFTIDDLTSLLAHFKTMDKASVIGTLSRKEFIESFSMLGQFSQTLFGRTIIIGALIFLIFFLKKMIIQTYLLYLLIDRSFIYLFICGNVIMFPKLREAQVFGASLSKCCLKLSHGTRSFPSPTSTLRILCVVSHFSPRAR
jgi:hypothetical protein